MCKIHHKVSSPSSCLHQQQAADVSHGKSDKFQDFPLFVLLSCEHGKPMPTPSTCNKRHVSLLKDQIGQYICIFLSHYKSSPNKGLWSLLEGIYTLDYDSLHIRYFTTLLSKPRGWWQIKNKLINGTNRMLVYQVTAHKPKLYFHINQNTKILLHSYTDVWL